MIFVYYVYLAARGRKISWNLEKSWSWNFTLSCWDPWDCLQQKTMVHMPRIYWQADVSKIISVYKLLLQSVMLRLGIRLDLKDKMFGLGLLCLALTVHLVALLTLLI